MTNAAAAPGRGVVALGVATSKVPSVTGVFFSSLDNPLLVLVPTAISSSDMESVSVYTDDDDIDDDDDNDDGTGCIDDDDDDDDNSGIDDDDDGIDDDTPNGGCSSTSFTRDRFTDRLSSIVSTSSDERL